MKGSFLLPFIVCVVGCTMPFSRPVPTESEYAAKLIFDIEGYDEDGSIAIGGERIWVIVAECIGDAYIGILDAQPTVEQSADVYLRFGAEIPFRPEHVIEIAQPPTKYVEWQLGQPPERKWPRNE